MLNSKILNLIKAIEIDIDGFDNIPFEIQESIACWILEDRKIKKKKDYAENRKND